MAKLNAVGDMIVVSADITLEEFETVKRFAPEALELKDEKDNVYFVVDRGNASISKYGICFSSRGNDGNIFMTTENVVTGNHDDIMRERFMIENEYAGILANLIKVEAQVRDALSAQKDTINKVASSITIDGVIN